MPNTIMTIVIMPRQQMLLKIVSYKFSRGGHSYTHCTDTSDRDQNLIELIFGLDRTLEGALILDQRREMGQESSFDH